MKVKNKTKKMKMFRFNSSRSLFTTRRLASCVDVKPFGARSCEVRHFGERCSSWLPSSDGKTNCLALTLSPSLTGMCFLLRWRDSWHVDLSTISRMLRKLEAEFRLRKLLRGISGLLCRISRTRVGFQVSLGCNVCLYWYLISLKRFEVNHCCQLSFQ